jgi:signal transduction histidine kinase
MTLGDDERDGDRESYLDLAPGVELKFDVARTKDEAKVYLDHQMFRRALINLVRNAVQAIEEAQVPDGRVQVRLARDGHYWEIDVDDNGPGIDENLGPAVFDPYVTSKTEGTGLGLAIVKKIVVEHGGTVRALASPLGGARIEIRLPAVGTPPAIALRDGGSEAPPSSRRSP